MGIRFADSARGSSWLTLRYKDLTSKIRAVVCGTCTPVHWYTHCEIDRHGKRGRAKGCFRVFRSGAASQFTVFHGHCCSPCRLYDLKYIWQNGSALLKGGKQRILARQVTTNVGYQHLSYPRAQNRGQYIRTIGSLNGDSAACLQLLHRRRRQRTGSRSAACMLPACLRGGRDAQAAPCSGVSARLAGSSGAVVGDAHRLCWSTGGVPDEPLLRRATWCAACLAGYRAAGGARGVRAALMCRPARSQRRPIDDKE